MHVRPALPRDVPAIASVAASAFNDADVFKHFSPYHYTYPEQFRTHFLQAIKRKMVSRDTVIMVAETDESDDGTGEGGIAGYAYWARYGSLEEVERWCPDGLIKRLERGLLSLEYHYSAWFGTDKIMNETVVADFRRQALEVEKEIAGFPSRLDLATLAISPAYQRRGVGGLLIDWGLEKAREEGVPVVLEATPNGLGLYLKKGFREIGECVLSSCMAEKERGVLQETGELRMPVMILDSHI